MSEAIDYDGIALGYAKKLEAIFTDAHLVPPQRVARAQLVVIQALKRFVPFYGSMSAAEQQVDALLALLDAAPPGDEYERVVGPIREDRRANIAARRVLASTEEAEAAGMSPLIADGLRRALMGDEIMAANPTPEIGWLAEMVSKTGPSWWSLTETQGEGGYFTKDSIKALRFARKEDAQAYIDDAGWTEVVPTEHQWG